MAYANAEIKMQPQP